MKCPHCRGDDESRVLDSRSTRDGDAIRRRRECNRCLKRFTTYEYVEKASMIVVKRDRRREDFSVNKLRKGIDFACKKRPISSDEIAALVDRVVKKSEAMGKTEVESMEIGTFVMDELYLLDQIAYIRFASVYRNFRTAEEFVRQVSTLMQ
jgi:transcriptional repressor NrdR